MRLDFPLLPDRYPDWNPMTDEQAQDSVDFLAEAYQLKRVRAGLPREDPPNWIEDEAATRAFGGLVETWRKTADASAMSDGELRRQVRVMARTANDDEYKRRMRLERYATWNNGRVFA